MRIDELINELNKIQEDHGFDIYVRVDLINDWLSPCKVEYREIEQEEQGITQIIKLVMIKE